MRHRHLLALFGSAFIAVMSPTALTYAQGCVAPVRQGACSLGSQGSPYLEAGGWRLSFSYRYFKSERHFVGSREDREREREHSEVINRVHLLDFGLAHAFTRRIGASLDVPVQFDTRSTPIRNAQGDIVDRDLSRADGIGDVVVRGTSWIFDPDEFLKGNVALSLGVKLPTGDKDVRHRATVRSGNALVREERTVDQSITPGDGSFGVVLGLQGFYTLLERFTLFTEGSYLFSPRNTNGVPTFRAGSGEDVMSVSDFYLARVGVGTPIPFLEKYGFAVSCAGRIEGVPVRDAIGASDGFRRPGYSVSIEPGISWSWNGHTLGVSAPVAVYRNRQRSVPEDEATPQRHGDAAYADYSIIFNYTFDFGGSSHASMPSDLLDMDAQH